MRKRLRAFWLSTLILFCLYSRADNNCDTTVWFVNIYPGAEIYELEGHSALHIETCGSDIAVNYGMFSFQTPNFVYRFVKGETDYMVGIQPWRQFLNNYIADGRRIVQHKLNLDSKQKARLMLLLQENLLPQNRVYRYNYVLDNCATRPLRMVELALADSIYVSEPADVFAPSLPTFRSYMKFYHAAYPWYQFGIDLALGSGIDREISVREKTFAPIVLDSQITNACFGKDKRHRLVTETTVLNDKSPFEAELNPTPWYLTPDFIFWTIAILLSVFSVRRVIKNNKFPRIIVAATFFLFGLAGMLITFLIFISVHEATSPNINILWLNPLCFLPVICLWFNSLKRVNYYYFLLNFVMLLALIVLWTAGFQTPNSAFIPLVIFDLLVSLLFLYYIRKSET